MARNVRSARWLIEAIEQRRTTLARVVQSIIRFQRPFFDQGPEHLQPLKMQQVADDVKLHVGTISRAVDDKYMQTAESLKARLPYMTIRVFPDASHNIHIQYPDEIARAVQEILL